MKRRLVPFINAFLVLICIAAAVIWTASYRSKITLVWTTGEERNQIVADSGIAYFEQVHKWWRHENVALKFDPQPGTSDLATWPGMRVDKHRLSIPAAMGFEHAQGAWKSPYVEITDSMRFTSKIDTPKVGTLYSSMTPIDIWACPFWFIVTVSALLPIIRFRNRGRVRTPINA